MRRGLFLLCCLSCLGGCAGPLPGGQAPEGTAFPRLLPLDPLIDRRPALNRRDATAEGQELAARAADLRLRAEMLRQLPL